MWFHRPFRADNWLLFATRSRTAGDGRGLATGEFFTRDGRLVASVTQEALLRPDCRAAETLIGAEPAAGFTPCVSRAPR